MQVAVLHNDIYIPMWEGQTRMSFEDRILVCRDCGDEFVFTAGEQEFYAQKGFLNNPVRCPECRRARKQSRTDGTRAGRGQRSRNQPS